MTIITCSIMTTFSISCKKPNPALASEYLLLITAHPGEGELEDVKKLIKQGADLDCVDEHYDLTPLLKAAYGKCEREYVRFENAEAEKTAELKSEEESIKIIQLLISKGANTKATDPKGSNTLHLAVYGGRPRMAAALIELGFDVHAVNKAGATPLIVAAASGSLETIKLLIEKGADINHITNENATALDIAEQYGHKDVAAYLKSIGVKNSLK